jgi:peptidoglycan hydrolase CwlO-like protein
VLTKRLEEAENSSIDAHRRVKQLQVSLDAKDKECLTLRKQADDLENRLGIKDKIIQSLESQLKTLRPDERKYEELLEAKKRTDQVNCEVIAQIGVLKDAIQAFQQQEKFNRKLIENQKRKDEEMKDLRRQVQTLIEMRPTETTGSMIRHYEDPFKYKLDETDQKDNKRTMNYDRLPSIHYDVTSDSVRPRSKSTGKKSSHDQTDAVKSMSPVKHSQMQQLQEQIRQLERAKDSFRDETIELRHQLKRLRQNNINMSSTGSVSHSF